MTRTQRGTSLVEMLVACAVLAAGVVAAVRLNTDLRLQAELSRQRHEAVRLAQQDIERLRAFATLPATNGLQSWDGIASAATIVEVDNGQGTALRYTLTRTVAELALPTLRHASVTAAWTDRNGTPRSVVLDTLIAGIAPAASGALALDAGRSAVQRPLGRSPMIPVAARDLGDGRSALKPSVSGGTAVVLDNETGAVVARCTGLAAGLRTQDLSAAHVANCTASAGLLLAGDIRSSSTNPASPGESTEAPPPVAVAVQIDGTPADAPLCGAEARKTVRYIAGGSLHVEGVPVDALPSSVGAAAWTDTGERHAAYACAVTPLLGEPRWSGRVAVTATGRGTCRYSADLDRSGAIDLPIEHGATYAGVATSLPHQNLLLVAAGAACPTAAAVTIEGTPGDVFADLGTAP